MKLKSSRPLGTVLAVSLLMALAGGSQAQTPSAPDAAPAKGGADRPAVLKGIEKHGFEVIGEFDAPGGLRGFAGVVGGQQPAAAYVTADGKHVVVGSLFDANGEDVGAAPLEKLAAKPMSERSWKKLDCHRFWEAARPWVDAGKVQLRHVMVGVIREDSPAKAAAILTAPNPSAALLENERLFDRGGIKPAASLTAEVANKLDANQVLMIELGFQGTPGILFKDAQGMVQRRSGMPQGDDMTVVLGPGWPGVLLHEAVGHGLEGDFNRKGTSVYAGRIGERVAAPGVTIVDDGTLDGRRGSLNIDDEGHPTQCTTLIEDGILVGYMQDSLNARLMGVAPTGNGRRESFAHMTMPRMTNTYMRAGQHDPEEMIRSVKRGLYAVNFGGGQVDITSGKYVFSATEAYLIEDGKITAPVKGATLIGNGPETMQKVRMIGNDLALDEGVGICGKDGQSVPVGVGQPSLLIDGITVGGTQA